MSLCRRVECVKCVSVCVWHAGEFSFLGSLILEAVISELATLHGLSTASDIYLAGSRCVLQRLVVLLTVTTTSVLVLGHVALMK